MGFDRSRFRSTVNTEFICPICYDVLQDPLMVAGCDHVYCAYCIKDWLQRSNNCPIDRNPVTVDSLQAPLRLFRSLLSQLLIRCSFDKCTEYVKLCELELHQMTCLHNPVNREKEISCPHKCGAMVKMQSDHNCIQYMQTVIKGYQCQVEELTTQLNNERQNIQLLKNIFQEEKKEYEEKVLNLKQEIETKEMMLELVNKSRKQSANVVATHQTEQSVSNGMEHSQNRRVLSSEDIAVLVELEDGQHHIDLLSHRRSQQECITSNSRFYDEVPNGRSKGGAAPAVKSKSTTHLNTDSKNFILKFSKMISNGPNVQVLANAELQYIQRHSTSDRVCQAMCMVNRRNFHSNSDFQRVSNIRKGSHSFSLLYEIRLMEYLEPFITPDSVVLDVGCGVGYLTCCIAQMARRVVGVEQFKDLVAKALKVMDTHHKRLLTQQRVVFVEGDGHQGQAKFSPYDLIVIEPTLVSKSVPEKLLQQLKPTGTLVTMMLRYHSTSHSSSNQQTNPKLELVKVTKRNNRNPIIELLCDNDKLLHANHKDILCKPNQMIDSMKFDPFQFFRNKVDTKQ